ncbi:hypothetical protein Droror1_Dr00026985 [Drosera rotundifolia]
MATTRARTTLAFNCESQVFSNSHGGEARATSVDKKWDGRKEEWFEKPPESSSLPCSQIIAGGNREWIRAVLMG